MATINTDYMVLGQPDGFTGQNVVRSRVFKTTVDNFGTSNPGDKLALGTNYAVAKFPKGFVPRNIVVNVLSKDNGTKAATLSVYTPKNVTNLSDATLGSAVGTAALNAVGTTLIGPALTTTATGSGTLTYTTARAITEWLTGENDYLVVSAARADSGTGDVDAKFEIVCTGDWPELTGVGHLPKSFTSI